jgi:hypothetical protein
VLHFLQIERLLAHLLIDTPGSGRLCFSLRDSRTFMNLSSVVSSARRQRPRPWLRGVSIHISHISWTSMATWFSNARAGSVLLSINAVPVVDWIEQVSRTVQW